MQAASESAGVQTLEREHGYPDLETYMRVIISNLEGPLFTTTVKDLFEVYISRLPAEVQQHYRCRACKNFVDKYLSLVTIDESSIVRPIFSDRDVPPFFRPSFEEMWARVAAAKVTGVFVTDKVVWGQPVTEAWTHLAGTPDKDDKYIFFNRPLTRSAGQQRAAFAEGFKMLSTAFEEIFQSAAEEAHRILASGQLRNSEAAVDQAKWFKDLPARKLHSRHVKDSLWRSVATSPEGFWHVRSNMLGTLLDALLAGESFAQIRTSWAQKMAPGQYLRPQAPPSSGAVKRAEDIFAQLGLGPALERRHARSSDVLETFWEPRGRQEEVLLASGLFGHLQTKDGIKAKVAAVELPPRVMTWAKFARDILPDVQKLQVVLDHLKGPYFGLTAAVNPFAPPLFQWDNSLERRNSVAWFFIIGGSPPSMWSLHSYEAVTVRAIIRRPDEWFTTAPMKEAFFVLEGARYAMPRSHNCIFPSCIRKELHEVRSVIEAFSLQAPLHGAAEGDVNGLAFGREAFHINLVVNDADRITLDRWE